MLEKPAPPNYLPVREDWLALRSEEALEPGADHRGCASPPVGPARLALHAGRYRARHRCLRPRRGGDRVHAMSNRLPQRRAAGAAPGWRGRSSLQASRTRISPGHSAGSTCGAGIVGHADLRLASRVAAVLDAHIQAGQGRFRGVRHLTTHDFDTSLMNPLSAGPPGLLGDDRFREGFAALAPKGLLFEAWLFHPQLPELTDLARAFPGTTIVLNHAGGMLGSGVYEGRRAEVLRGWSRDITRRWLPARTFTSSWAAWGCGLAASGSNEARSRRAPPNWRLRGARM